MSEAKRILVVEDEWLLASELSRRLRSAGYAIVGPAPTVADALNRIEETTPDAAILDVQLEGETTFALAMVLTEQSIPFFFLSGHSMSDHTEFSGQTVVPKPADWRIVLSTLERKLSGTSRDRPSPSV